MLSRTPRRLLSGDPERGIEELSRAIRDAEEVFGASSMMVGFYSQNLVSYLLKVGEVERAIEGSDRALAILSEHAQPESYTLAAVRGTRGLALLEARRGGPALSELHLASQTFARVLSPTHERTLSARSYRGLALAYVGRVGEAVEELESVLSSGGRTIPALESASLRILGTVLRLSGEPEKALRAHREALQAIEDGPAAELNRVLVRIELALDQVELGQSREAAPSLLSAVDDLRSTESRPSPRRAEALAGLGRARMDLGDAAGAAEALEEAEELWRDFESDDRWAGEAALWLGLCYRSLGRGAESGDALARAAEKLSRSPLPLDERLRLLALGRK